MKIFFTVELAWIPFGVFWELFAPAAPLAPSGLDDSWHLAMALKTIAA